MSDSMFYIIMAIAGVALFVIMVFYFMLSKRYSKEDLKYIKELKKGTEQNAFHQMFYIKSYMFFTQNFLS